MRSRKDKAVIWSARVGLPTLFRGAPGQGLTVLLFHSFTFNGESTVLARERLRGQLDFLVRRFTPVRLEGDLTRHVRSADARPPVLVTIDDAKRDLLDFIDLFDSFGVPVAQFICAGWTDRASNSNSAAGLKARIVSWLYFYDGPPQTLPMGKAQVTLDSQGNAALIDQVIAAAPADLEALCSREAETRNCGDGRTICTWPELADLQAAGMVMGCHSVSHPRIGQQSAARARFEITASRALVEAELGPCPWFAYPYGTPEAHSPVSHDILKAAGIDAAFTTRPALVRNGADPLALPRIAMPDKAMDQAHFEARATGGNIPFARLKEWIS